MAEIIDIQERWENHSGLEVENYIKREFGSKYAVIRISDTINENNFYSLEMFHSEADALAYDADPEGNQDLITIVPIPISTVQGDAYTARLSTTIANTANIIVTDNTLLVPLNYRAIQITPIGNVNAGAAGTIVVQTSTNGETWNTVGTIANALQSSEPEDDTTVSNVDIGQFLVEGKQMVRLRATYTYQNENGETKTVNSSNVVVGASVTRTALRLELRDDFQTPKMAYENGVQSTFNLKYMVYGAVRKTLHLEVTGSVDTFKSTKILSETEDAVNTDIAISEDSAYGLLTHGVRKVVAWLEAEDGLGNTITSETLVNRFMVVDTVTQGIDHTKPYLLMQNVDEEASNYIQTELAQYAVYSPLINDDGSVTNDGDAINVAFLLTDYTEDYETIKPNEYFRLEHMVAPKQAYSLLTTIEIESESEGEVINYYDTYLRARRVEGDTSTDFLRESTGESSYYIKVDNSSSFTPVTGSTFLLNPKVRNNTEANPRRILNARNNNEEIESEWNNFGFITDGWVTAEDGQKVLRIPAGASLKIKMNVWKQFLTTPASSMTFEIDYAVRNITNLTEPIICMCEDNDSGGFRGLKMNALDGWLMTASYFSKDDCLFSWQEDKRTFVSFNMHHSVKPNLGDVQYPTSATNADGTIALARIFVNGDITREVPFSTTNANEWCTSTDGDIIIGNEGADIDIYSLRVYTNKQLEATELLNRNFLSSRPTAAEKQRVYERNNILTSGRIDIEKVKQLGINCMVWHGALAYYYAQSEMTGWYEYFRFDDNGNYLPEFSGTNCKATKCLTTKGQGSTAKTYYDWNQQDDNSKVKYNFSSQKNTIMVALADIHESIVVSEPYEGSIEEDENKGGTYQGTIVDIYGGNLGKNFPIENTPRQYPYINGQVMLPDGWIDGNGKYRGMGYCVTEGTSLAQKKVIKINYASSMQSHLPGACKTYDLLHRIVVGETPLQKVVPTAVSAKHIEPFMYFSQDNDSAPVYYRGLGTYGAGKMDKVTWGYVKKLHPMFTLIEGSDNNLPMTGFRVPFDKITAVYSPEDEGWLYAGQQSFDFDAGDTTEELTDGWQYQGTGEAPKAHIRDRWADIHNFIYLHSSNIKYFNGTLAQFKASDNANDTAYKYWCTSGDYRYILYRFDYLTSEWIDAGLYNETTKAYKQIDLRTYSLTKSAYEGNVSSGDYSVINNAFISAMVAHMKKYLKYFINEKSLQFNYNYVLGLLGGTDNSDKNTYYKIMPYAEDFSSEADTEDGVAFSAWFTEEFGKSFSFAEVYQLYFDGDDMDSIFRTNNNSHQTKPYYIDRMHPYDDEKPDECLYEGMNNQLFNFVEKAYSADHTLANVMNEILVAATEIVSRDDIFYGEIADDNKKSALGFLHKYFFNIQHYFPQVAFNEQARIRYEFPQLIGFISQGGGARNITPISQSLGSQLQNELQYMHQRLIYMASYAGFGTFSGMTEYSIGLTEANDTFNFTPSAMPDGTGADYTFTVKTHQYLYLSYNVGTTYTNTHLRCKPDTATTFTMAKNISGSDTGMGICGINYISDLGDLSDKSITSSNLKIVGKRLTRIYAPYNAKMPFRPEAITFDAPFVKEINIAVGKHQQMFNLSKLTRLQSVRAGFCHYVEVILPASNVLTDVSFSVIHSISIDNLPNLASFTLEEPKQMKVLKIGTNVGTDAFSSQELVTKIYYDQMSLATPNLTEISIRNIQWTDLPIAALQWYMGIAKCDFQGTISIYEPSTVQPAITFAIKDAINRKFGNVDNPDSEGHQGLLLDYMQREVTSITVTGNAYASEDSVLPMYVPFTAKPASTYQNAFTKVRYSASGNVSSKCSIDALTGILTVTSLSTIPDNVTVTCTVTTYMDGVESTISASKTIPLWARPAQLGDFVYYDGTYGSPADYNGEKTPIGVCFYLAPRNEDGSLNTTFSVKGDKHLRLMVALEDVITIGTTGEFSAWQWGTQQIHRGNESITEKEALYDISNSTGERIALTTEVLTSIYDIPTIIPIRLYGTNNGYLDVSVNASSNYRDTESEEGDINKGFRCITPDCAMGDGFSYRESTDYSAITESRTLTASLAQLAGNGYAEGDIVNMGYAKTLKIIEHRNIILTSDIIGADDAVFIKANKFPTPVATTTQSELQSLVAIIEAMRAWAKEELQDAYPNRWSQLVYPAASNCYAYQPSVRSSELLADRFKRHKWWLPTIGQMSRIVWYVKFGDLYNQNIFSQAEEVVGKILKKITYHVSTQGVDSQVWDTDMNSGAVHDKWYLRYNSLATHPITAF